MRIIVFGKTQESANYKLDEILYHIPYGEVKTVKKGKNDYSVELTDGTRYISRAAIQNVRGHRCDKVYVEYGVDAEIVDCVITPILCVSKLPLEQQMEWF